MPVTAEAPPPATPRLICLDALRGFDMFWIIGGDLVVRLLPKIHESRLTQTLAAQMDHCEWAGFHFYDLIFPMFVFIVGVSLVFSVSRMVERAGRMAAIKRIVVRSVILFLLGISYMDGVADGFKNVYLTGIIVNWRRLSLRFVGGDVKALLGDYSELAVALVGLGLALCLVSFLYRRKIFLRL
jgi:predicted acyltransferase